jgi:hypothetical protein
MVFQDAMQCNLIYGYQVQLLCSDGKYKLTQQDALLENCMGTKVSEESIPFTFRAEETLEMDAAGSSETSIPIHQTTRRQISYNL